MPVTRGPRLCEEFTGWLRAFGHYSQNYQQAYNGRRGVVVSALAAVLIGGAPYIISFFLHRGAAIG
jgi:hypothetical protein